MRGHVEGVRRIMEPFNKWDEERRGPAEALCEQETTILVTPEGPHPGYKCILTKNHKSKWHKDKYGNEWTRG